MTDDGHILILQIQWYIFSEHLVTKTRQTWMQT